MDFRYDTRNFMVGSVTPEGTETEYGYDALGRRLWKRTEACETRFFWAGEQIVAELSADRTGGRVSRQEFLYHPVTNAPIATCVDGVVYDIHCDQLGTPRAVVSQQGELVWHAGYTAFGHATVVRENVPMPLRLPGQFSTRKPACTTTASATNADFNHGLSSPNHKDALTYGELP